MSGLMRLLREPLLHFAVIGGLLFVFYFAVSGPSPEPVNRIVVEPERVAQLAAGYAAVWQRPPSEDELRALVESFVREEVYYREALALGLEQDDTIIRRRMQQKMEFLTDSGTEFLEPDAGELEAYYRANELRFQNPPRVAMTQIFYGQNPTPELIATALTMLQRNPAADPQSFGERTLLPMQLALSTPAAIDGVFGVGFFDELIAVPIDVWAGPVESGYGVHLVRVEESLPANSLPLGEVRDVVLREWRSAKATELRDQIYARLRARYEIMLPDDFSADSP